MHRTTTRALLCAGLAVAAATPLAGAGSAGAAGGDPRQVGQFTEAFEEAGGTTCVIDKDGRELCKPAGTSQVNLATGRVLYWDALEGTENVNLNALLEGAHQTRNDRTRLLDLSTGTPRFRTPSPEDSGANPNGNASSYLPLVPHDDPIINDGDLFCSDLVQLADGSILAAGGTDYFAEPYVGELQGTQYGLIELEGLKASRIFDARTETWRQTGAMHFSRWYPSLVTLAGGDVFVASGVGKLVKPMYAERPFDSGTNVRQTETYHPATGEWRLNPSSANRSLPLYPRLHLLPNGHVYYDAAGQVFNPAGESYDEALWNIAASYDPVKAQWTDLGVPGLGLGALPGLPDLPLHNGQLAGMPFMANVPLDGLPNAGGDFTGAPGFRGSAFSIMLPLRPDADGRYSSAHFLSAGGILGVTPGTYFATTSSQINTVTIDGAGKETLSSRATGPLNAARWYGTGVALPTGEVMIISGANRDEVVGPGTAEPVTTPELFDPATGTWRQMAPQGRSRTYHNTGMLLPDGRVLVGGHAPIPTGYAFNVGLPSMSPQEGRDASFEVYSPPYLFNGARPSIVQAPSALSTGTRFDVTLGSAAEAESVQFKGTVVLVRNTAITHLIDGDQRSVVLPVVSRDGATLTVQAPPNQAVAPAGPYMLFANQPGTSGLVPSVSKQVFVDAPAPAPAQLQPASPGQVTAPFVGTPPEQVVMENLADALGVPGVPVATRLTSDRRSGLHAPAWLVLLAAGLPMAVLTAAPEVRKRSRARARAGIG